MRDGGCQWGKKKGGTSVIYSTIKEKRDKEMTDTFINDIVKLNRHLGEM